MLFRCFLYLDVHYSDHHCIDIPVNQVSNIQIPFCLEIVICAVSGLYKNCKLIKINSNKLQAEISLLNCYQAAPVFLFSCFPITRRSSRLDGNFNSENVYWTVFGVRIKCLIIVKSVYLLPSSKSFLEWQPCHYSAEMLDFYHTIEL